MKCFIVIKSIKLFGYYYILEYLLPNTIQIIGLLKENVVFKFNNYFIQVEKEKIKINNNTNVENSNQKFQFPLDSFGLKSFIPSNFNLFTYSNSQSDPNSFSSNKQKNSDYIEKKVFKILDNSFNNNYEDYFDYLVCNIYSEIFESLSFIMNEMKNKENEKEKLEQIKINLIEFFGEDIMKLLINYK